MKKKPRVFFPILTIAGALIVAPSHPMVAATAIAMSLALALAVNFYHRV